MSLPPQPNYPPPYPQNPAGAPGYPPQPGYPQPAPFPAGPAPAPFAAPRPATPPKPPRRPSVAQVVGALATLWALALIVFIVLWRPMQKWAFDALTSESGGPSFATRFRVADWVLYALPFLVGGIAAAAFLRPGIARVAIAGAIAVVVPLATEFGLTVLFDNLEVTHVSIYFVAYALTTTAFGLAWLVLRGRSPARVLIGFAVLPLNWLLELAHNQLIQAEGVRKVLHTDFDYSLFAGLLLFFFTAISLAIPLWLAAIGQSATAPRPLGSFVPAPAGWPAQTAGAPAGWPAPAAPAWTPGQPAPAYSGWPAPGQPVPGQLVPGQLVPGQLVPGQLVPGQPVPGQSVPGQPGWPAQAQPVPGQSSWPTTGQPASAPPASAPPPWTAPGQPAPAQPGWTAPGQPTSGQPAAGQPIWPAPGQPGQGGWPATPPEPPANS